MALGKIDTKQPKVKQKRANSYKAQFVTGFSENGKIVFLRVLLFLFCFFFSLVCQNGYFMLCSVWFMSYFLVSLMILFVFGSPGQCRWSDIVVITFQEFQDRRMSSGRIYWFNLEMIKIYASVTGLMVECQQNLV